MKFLMDIIIPPFRGINGKCNVDMTKKNNFLQSQTDETCCDYPLKVLDNLNALRQNSRFCDVEIIAGEKIIKAHKAVLAASSNYFQAMFTGGLCEKDQNSVELHAISPNTLESLIDFIYSGKVCISQNNVQELMIAADMLEMHEIVSCCSTFLIKELHPINAIGIYRFAEGHNWLNLANEAMGYVESHFPEICQEEEIYELPKEEFIKFLSSERLRVDSEFQVFQAAIKWVEHNIIDRRRYVFEILKYVRLPLFSINLLEKAVNDCTDGSLKVALKSVHNDLINRKGCLVTLSVLPRHLAKRDIYVIGGNKRELAWHRGTESSYVSVVKFNTFTKEWTTAPDLIVNRIVPGVATLNGKIYVVGGEQESTSLNSCECYEPDEPCWKSVASMIVPRCEFGLCALNGYLYALGGWVGSDIGGCIERYDSRIDEWKHVGVMPEPRFSMGVVTYAGLIYMVGGCTHSRRHLTDLLSFNPLTGEWKSLPHMTVARSQMGVAVIDDYLYVIGGDNKNSILDSVERYSFKQNKWSKVPSMMVARSRPAVVVVDKLLYVIGGSQTTDDFYRAQFTLDSVECYDTVSYRWTSCPALPESRAESGAVVI
nr:actin-binding protein IPP [Onthophagus taurus]XP_022915945.1 actin-binding protein IPP [Onthophagus taurus]